MLKQEAGFSKLEFPENLLKTFQQSFLHKKDCKISALDQSKGKALRIGQKKSWGLFASFTIIGLSAKYSGNKITTT